MSLPKDREELLHSGWLVKIDYGNFLNRPKKSLGTTSKS